MTDSNKVPTPDTALRNQVLALAASLQCLSIVDGIARHGTADAETLESALKSLFTFDAESPVALFSDERQLKTGLLILHDLLGRQRSEDSRRLMRYFMGCVHIHQSLRRKPEMTAIIRSRLDHAAKSIQLSGFDLDNVAASVAGIYQDTLSTLRYRIQVTGSARQLQDSRNAARIRAMLLASVRFFFLWRQHGGRRLHLVLRRGRLREACRAVLESLESPTLH